MAEEKTKFRISWRVNLGVFVALAVFFALVFALGQSIRPLVFALLFSYALNPGVKYLVRRRFPRWLAVLTLFIFFVVAAAAVIGCLVFILMREVPVLVNRFPEYLDTFKREQFPVISSYLGLQSTDFDTLTKEVIARLTHLSPKSYSDAAGYVVRILSGTLNVVYSAFLIILIPVLMIYILMDYQKMEDKFLGILPPSYKDEILAKLKQVETVLKDFLKGQLLVAIILGILFSAGFWIIGVDAPVLVGMGTGLLNMVPYLGTATGIAVSIILLALKYHDILHPALALAVVAVVHAFEGYLITPKIVGEKLGLHPVVIIVSLLVFGEIFGFVGILVAVPVAAVLKVFLRDFIRDYMESGLYTGDGGDKT